MQLLIMARHCTIDAAVICRSAAANLDWQPRVSGLNFRVVCGPPLRAPATPSSITHGLWFVRASRKCARRPETAGNNRSDRRRSPQPAERSLNLRSPKPMLSMRVYSAQLAHLTRILTSAAAAAAHRLLSAWYISRCRPRSPEPCTTLSGPSEAGSRAARRAHGPACRLLCQQQEA